MMNLHCLKTFNQGWLSWRGIVLIVGQARGGSDLCPFLRPFYGLTTMSVMQIAVFHTLSSQTFWKSQLLLMVLMCGNALDLTWLS